ncbi:MAG: SIS domain-containing protein [Nitrospirae bacterium]|nr:SIS domain-containing protein [Nitrospirota bacterium]
MKAFLLAAGKGKRLRPLTDKIPKCLVPIRGRPLLEYWFDLCERYGIKEVIVNMHHLADMVRRHVRENPRSLSIHLSYEEELLGSAGTIVANREFVEGEENFFIFYADNLTNIRLDKLIEFHQVHRSLFTMGLFNTDCPQQCGIAQLTEEHLITDFTEKPRNPRSNLANAGIYLTTPSIFDYIPNKKVMDMGLDVLPRLVNRMHGYSIKEYLIDIGDKENYCRAQIEWPNGSEARASQRLTERSDRTKLIKRYISQIGAVVNHLPAEQIQGIIQLLLEAYQEQKSIFIMGNGGSAATASHFANDLAKGTHVPGRKRFRVIALTDNVPLMTAWGNDSSYEDIFVEQLRNLHHGRALVIGISASGNSENVLKALRFAREEGGITIGLTGFDGGKLKEVTDECFIVPSHSMAQVEDAHLILEHLICTVLKEEISKL